MFKLGRHPIKSGDALLTLLLVTDHPSSENEQEGVMVVSKFFLDTFLLIIPKGVI